MVMDENKYFAIRSAFLNSNQDKIHALEQSYMQFLVTTTLSVADSIHRDLSYATDLRPFWINYPPRQRGRSPTGQSIPWGDAGEKTIGLRLTRAIAENNPSVFYPGLPLGGDIRFATSDVLIHLDLKLTGPNDNADEIVASPHQVSGDGLFWENGGVINSPVTVQGPRRSMNFQPELPPLYILKDTTKICLTYFIKAVYDVRSFGEQPLRHLELACVPNGLLMFAGPAYSSTPGLLIPGKDEADYIKKRTRVRLAPLSNLDSWRCIKIMPKDGNWQDVSRSDRSN